MIKAISSPHPTIKKLFQNRKMMICSMHGKDLVMRPLVKQYLNINSENVGELDTDEFGTFSGEVQRPFDPITTLRKKILKGLKLSGETLGIGNEGSFGPHFQIPFIQADQEIVMLIDLQNDVEIYEAVTSTETNHARKEINGMNDLLAFADRIQFPMHGMILKEVKDGKVINIRKGIMTWEALHAVSQQFTSKQTALIAESDMRAYLNPTRMKIIERATEHLMKKIINTCPECQWPGFGCVETIPGLPCRQCGEPTKLLLIKVYQCKNCHYRDERYYTAGENADPQYCDHCNP